MADENVENAQPEEAEEVSTEAVEPEELDGDRKPLPEEAPEDGEAVEEDAPAE